MSAQLDAVKSKLTAKKASKDKARVKLAAIDTAKMANIGQAKTAIKEIVDLLTEYLAE